MQHDSELFARQAAFGPIGLEGQQRLMESRATICGCGALGSTIAQWLARAGVGFLRLVDDDQVATVNLHRQILFHPADVPDRRKVDAAAKQLALYEGPTEIEPVFTRFEQSNATELCEDVDLIIDATDNFKTRYVINETAVQLGIPWIYGGAMGGRGQVMTILPGRTPCLRCMLGEWSPQYDSDSCVVSGILGPTAGTIASIESVEALKVLSGNLDAVASRLMVLDLWNGKIQTVDAMPSTGGDPCVVCGYVGSSEA